METITPDGSTDFIETILNCFEYRIPKIEAAFSTSEAIDDSSDDLLKNFQKSLLELRTERSRLNKLLRNNLAKNGSLRKNDYDCLMDELFTFLNAKEKEAECQFYHYVADQKQMVLFLRQSILEIKSLGQDDYKEKIAVFKTRLDTILESQQHRKETAIMKFTEFRHLHQKITGKFKQLLEQDVHIFCKDIKNVKRQLLEELAN